MTDITIKGSGGQNAIFTARATEITADTRSLLHTQLDEIIDGVRVANEVAASPDLNDNRTAPNPVSPEVRKGIEGTAFIDVVLSKVEGDNPDYIFADIIDDCGRSINAGDWHRDGEFSLIRIKLPHMAQPEVEMNSERLTERFAHLTPQQSFTPQTAAEDFLQQELADTRAKLASYVAEKMADDQKAMVKEVSTVERKPGSYALEVWIALGNDMVPVALNTPELLFGAAVAQIEALRRIADANQTEAMEAHAQLTKVWDAIADTSVAQQVASQVPELETTLIEAVIGGLVSEHRSAKEMYEMVLTDKVYPTKVTREFRRRGEFNHPTGNATGMFLTRFGSEVAVEFVQDIEALVHPSRLAALFGKKAENKPTRVKHLVMLNRAKIEILEEATRVGE